MGSATKWVLTCAAAVAACVGVLCWTNVGTVGAGDELRSGRQLGGEVAAVNPTLNDEATEYMQEALILAIKKKDVGLTAEEQRRQEHLANKIGATYTNYMSVVDEHDLHAEEKRSQEHIADEPGAAGANYMSNAGEHGSDAAEHWRQEHIEEATSAADTNSMPSVYENKNAYDDAHNIGKHKPVGSNPFLTKKSKGGWGAEGDHH